MPSTSIPMLLPKPARTSRPRPGLPACMYRNAPCKNGQTTSNAKHQTTSNSQRTISSYPTLPTSLPASRTPTPHALLPVITIPCPSASSLPNPPSASLPTAHSRSSCPPKPSPSSRRSPRHKAYVAPTAVTFTPSPTDPPSACSSRGSARLHPPCMADQPITSPSRTPMADEASPTNTSPATSTYKSSIKTIGQSIVNCQ